MPESEFRSMQEDAIRRVHEMQRRSRNYVAGESTAETGAAPPPQEGRADLPQEKKPQTGKALFNIGGIKIDEEKAMIALLIYILYKNKADIKLILGLGYLLL